MKSAKTIGILLIVFGVVLAVIGATVTGILMIAKRSSGTSTTAQIVSIEKSMYSDSFVVYVEFEVDGQKTTAALNSYNSGFYVGKQIDIFYFENDLHYAYQSGSDVILMIVFVSFGTLIAAAGAVVLYLDKHTLLFC